MNFRHFLGSFVVIGLMLAPVGASAQDAPSRPKVASLLVLKSDRKMIAYDEAGKEIETYRFSLGKSPTGPKQEAGDQKTPEGKYFINAHNKSSSYFLSLRISYPDEADVKRAKKQGVDPGGAIFIHGQPNRNGWNWQKYSVGRDWTNGCISVTNGDMKELWDTVEDGTPIEIKP